MQRWKRSFTLIFSYLVLAIFLVFGCSQNSPDSRNGARSSNLLYQGKNSLNLNGSKSLVPKDDESSGSTLQGGNCFDAGSIWQNQGFGTVNGEFSTTFTARTPTLIPAHSIAALSLSAGASFIDYAILIRFNWQDQVIDARNGDTYEADRRVFYVANQEYRFNVVTNLNTGTYSVFVTTPQGQREAVARNYSFRSEQAGLQNLNNFGVWSHPDYVGATYCDLEVFSRGGNGENIPPIADAGPDQMVRDDDQDGQATVVLNGSNSIDPDGVIIGYGWYLGNQEIATGSNPTVNLSVGTHHLQLHVLDNGGLRDVDTVEITVNPGSGGGGCQKPTEYNVGLSNPNILQRHTGDYTVTQPGLVENLDIEGGMLRIQSNNVTVRNVRVTNHGGLYALLTAHPSHNFTHPYRNIVIEDSHFRGGSHAVALLGGSGNVAGDGVIFRRSIISDGGGDGFKLTGGRVSIQNTYVTRLGYIPEKHADGVQAQDGNNYEVRCTNFYMPIPEGAEGDGIHASNSALMFKTTNSPIYNVHVEDVWAYGGNMTFYIQEHAGNGNGQVTNVTLRNIEFGWQHVDSDADPRVLLHYRYGTIYSTGSMNTQNLHCPDGRPLVNGHCRQY